MRTTSLTYRFFMVIMVVIVAGMSQGLLLPLLTILLEKSGIPSGMNGLNAAGLYVGTFIAMLFIEKPVRKLGYKRMIMAGMLLVTIATLLFPLWNNLIFWFILRLAVGIGDSSLHYATQLWITSSSPPNKRGRNISLYGMSYGIGFSIGPVGINLLRFGDWVPFAAICLFYLAALGFLLRLTNEFPAREQKEMSRGQRYSGTLKIAWFALIPSFLYGCMESSMNSNFPVYGLRMGLSEEAISLLLPAIGIGGLILQLPLGILSDRKGRKPVLMGAGFIGSLAFLAVPFMEDDVWKIFVLLLAAGGLVGSFYSLGLAYAADLLPKSILPAANVIASINFSIGSIVGPNLGGFGIQFVSPATMFYFLGAVFFAFSVAAFSFGETSTSEKVH
ncbi:MFS transporter [Aneurinibacillus terranovensis]|uniref:MFS transporter n=1 Tax=Aneurinibacillus terranovensis TaxID=278991 RepID=UPI00041C2E35|nr:MFS transporter [Aneurinibacillus terranovensis]